MLLVPSRQQHLVPFLLLFLLPLSLDAKEDEIRGYVIRIISEDSIAVMTNRGTEVTITLHAVDAPEKWQDHGEEAADGLSRMLYRKSVRVELQGKGERGHRRGTVLLGKEDINLKMIAQGLAWHVANHWGHSGASQKQSEIYSKAEANAKAKKIGLWSATDLIPPWEFRSIPAEVRANLEKNNRLAWANRLEEQAERLKKAHASRKELHFSQAAVLQRQTTCLLNQYSQSTKRQLLARQTELRGNIKTNTSRLGELRQEAKEYGSYETWRIEQKKRDWLRSGIWTHGEIERLAATMERTRQIKLDTYDIEIRSFERTIAKQKEELKEVEKALAMLWRR